ncbi:hypothetical protein DPX16_23525 [Anabarilius grahami]|uniref:Uncharacterized protein n=1 Tax=Anabarilius grahami TaxID=495550 RepID=A0A3N0Z1C5_ANAGA|nr:hypothetical protein DPX16_23525 [Anabarilius grahami]
MTSHQFVLRFRLKYTGAFRYLRLTVPVLLLLRRLRLLGLQIELAEDFEAGISLSRASPISSRALIPDPEAHSAASTDLTEGMLLASGSEEDATRIEVDITVFDSGKRLVGVALDGNMPSALLVLKFFYVFEKRLAAACGGHPTWPTSKYDIRSQAHSTLQPILKILLVMSITVLIAYTKN